MGRDHRKWVHKNSTQTSPQDTLVLSLSSFLLATGLLSLKQRQCQFLVSFLHKKLERVLNQMYQWLGPMDLCLMLSEYWEIMRKVTAHLERDCCIFTCFYWCIILTPHNPTTVMDSCMHKTKFGPFISPGPLLSFSFPLILFLHFNGLTIIFF